MIRKPTLWKRFKKRLWKVSKWGLVFFGVALVSGYAFVRYDYLTAADDLEHQESMAKENGFSLTAEDMRPKPPVKPEENAAPIYRKMIVAIKAVPDIERGLSYLDLTHAASSPGKDNLMVANVGVNVYSKAIELTKAASAKPRCDFERDWSNPWSVGFPEYATFKSGANLLSARAILRARNGDVDGSISDIRSIFRMPRHIEEEKTLISALIAIAVDAIATRTIRDCSIFLAHDSKSLNKYKLLLNALPQVPAYLPFIKGDVYFGYGTCMQLKAISEQIERDRPTDPIGTADFYSDSPPFGNPTILVLPPIIESNLCERAYAAKYLGAWNRAFDSIKTDQNSKLNFATYLDKETMAFENSILPSDQLNKFMFPVFSQAGKSFVKRSFHRQSVIAFIELLQYRNRTGAFPNTLKEAAIASVEPYGKTILNYRKTEAGFRIYDLGYNGKDDGGKFSWEAPGTENDDRPMYFYPYGENASPQNRGKPLRAVEQYLLKLKTKESPGKPLSQD